MLILKHILYGRSVHWYLSWQLDFSFNSHDTWLQWSGWLFCFPFCISDFAVFLCNERVMMCVPFVEKTNEQTKTKYKQKTEKRNFFHLCYYWTCTGKLMLFDLSCLSSLGKRSQIEWLPNVNGFVCCTSCQWQDRSVDRLLIWHVIFHFQWSNSFNLFCVPTHVFCDIPDLPNFCCLYSQPVHLTTCNSTHNNM